MMDADLTRMEMQLDRASRNNSELVMSRTFGSKGMGMFASTRSCRSSKCCLCPPQRELEEVQTDLEGSKHSGKLREQAEVMEKAW
ncbi:hypothetical protein BTVI_27660 [Pitangus sulphuratus]|nr:hypothetical protein BTVI_27660 [Pitangus sulphuratus]